MITKPTQYSEVLVGYEHQQQETIKTLTLKHWALFWEMGTGKTKVVIDTVQALFTRCEIDGCLVIAPKGCYLNWRDSEIPAHWPIGMTHRVATHRAVMRKQEQYEFSEICAAKNDCMDFLLINTEAFSSDKGLLAAMKFLRSHYTMVVIDESSCIKSHRAQRTRNILRLREMCEYRRIMSGTPISNSPLDLFSQCMFLADGLLGFNNWTTFKNFYAREHRMTFGNRSFNKIVGYQNLEVMTEKLKKFSSRILKSECLDLPEKVYETHYVEHTPEQSEIYRKMRDEAILQFDQGLVTSTSALTTIMKLHQINCGHIKGDDGVLMDLPSNRIGELLDLIELIQGKVIVWGHFRRDVEFIHEALCEKYGQQACVHYYGETSDSDRAMGLRRFMSDPECRFFTGNPETGGKSLTLTAASTVIYYSNSYSLEHRLQSEDRAHRIGQRNVVTYIDMIARGTIDEKIVRVLRQKRDLAASVLDDFAMLLGEGVA